MGAPPLKYMLLRNVAAVSSKRRQLRNGDVFVYRPGKSNYFWGRLISTRCATVPSNGHLIFLYDASTSGSDHVPWDAMRTDNLLTPPLVTNSTPWNKGYFRTVDSRLVQAEDGLEPVFFVNYKREVVDVDGAAVCTNPPMAAEAMLPTIGLHNVRLIDELLKQRLGVPTLEDVVDRCVSSFCRCRSIQKPGPAWISGIMLTLDEGRSDKILHAYLSRAFSSNGDVALGELVRELRDAAENYHPETMDHIRSV